MFNNPFSNKKDPLLEAVQNAMQDGEIRRQAEALVNEEFGVYSRKAVVREDLAAYDRAIEEVYAELTEGNKEKKKRWEEDRGLRKLGLSQLRSSSDFMKYRKASRETPPTKKELARNPSKHLPEDNVAELNEISKGTLGSYVGKSANANYGKEKLEREKGVKLAMKKISGRGVKVKATNEELADKKDEPKLDMKAREKAKSDYSKMREKMVGKGKDLETTRKIVGEAKKLADKDYVNKKDHKKIDIYHKGQYKASTTWAKNTKEAKAKWLEKNKDHDPKDVKTNYAPMKEANYGNLADKDYDKDGKIESGKAEYQGSRIRAAKMAGKMEEGTKIVSKGYGKVEVVRGRKKVKSFKDPRDAKMFVGKPKTVKEEEQLDELEKKTLRKYKAKAIDYVSDTMAGKKGKEGISKLDNRVTGIERANKRMGVKMEETQLDELKRSTLTSYIRKASKSKATPENISKRGKGMEMAAKKIERMEEELSHGARELTLHADNDSQLHRSSHQPIIKNLQRKHAKGAYDHEKATKLWKYHADRAAKSYEKQHGGRFSVADRKAAAAHFADSARSEHGFGSVKEAKMTRSQKDMAVRRFMSHDPDAGERILAQGKKEREEKKSFASAAKEANLRKTKATFPNVKHTTSSGHPDWEKHGIKDIPTIKEEQIDELRRSTLVSYIRKASKSKATPENISKRSKGLEMASKKLEETQLDELSRKTLGSYIKKASHDVATKSAATRNHAMKADISRGSNDYMDARKHDEISNKMFNKSWKRRQGIAKAVDKLSEAAYSAKAARAGKDIGKPGKTFSKIAKSAGERYGSEESGKKVAGSILAKIRAKHMKEDSSFNAALVTGKSVGEAIDLPPAPSHYERPAIRGPAVAGQPAKQAPRAFSARFGSRGMTARSTGGTSSFSQGGANIGQKMSSSSPSQVVTKMSDAGRAALNAPKTPIAAAASRGLGALGTVARVAANPVVGGVAAAMTPTPANSGEDEKARQARMGQSLPNVAPGQGSTKNIAPVSGGSIPTNAGRTTTSTPKAEPAKQTFRQAFSAAREKAKEIGDASRGQFEYGGKKFQTNIAPAKGTEKYVPSSKQTETGIKAEPATKPVDNVPSPPRRPADLETTATQPPKDDDKKVKASVSTMNESVVSVGENKYRIV